jgi:hypothetical protein
MKLAAGKLIHHGYLGGNRIEVWPDQQRNMAQSQFVASIFLWKMDRHCAGYGAFPEMLAKAFNCCQFWHHW